jgi:hypothetical protein
MATTVKMQESFGGLVARVLKRKLQRDLDRTTEKALLALKAAAEAKSASGTPCRHRRVVGSPWRPEGESTSQSS